MSTILIGLLSRAVSFVACVLGAAHQTADRRARQLAGAPDPVDQRWADTLAATGTTPRTWKPGSAAEHEYVDAVRRLFALPHPDALPDVTGRTHGNVCLTDLVDVLVQHVPANSVGAPEATAAVVPFATGALIVTGGHSVDGHRRAVTALAEAREHEQVAQPFVPAAIASVIAGLYEVGTDPARIDRDARLVAREMRTAGLVLARRTT